jgi:predicted MFS family arabinose efflux permease
MGQSIRDGLRYIKSDPLLLKTIAVVLIVATFAMNFNVLVPVFSDAVLHQQESGFGFLMSFMGIGSFFGAMFIATKSKDGPGGFVLKFFPVFIAAALVFIGFTHLYIMTALGLAASGFFFVAYSSSANSTLQLHTKSEYRGRVMSIYTLVFGGSTPIGNLYAGLFTEHLGPSAGFIACGVVIIALLALALIFMRYRGKRIYPRNN